MDDTVTDSGQGVPRESPDIPLLSVEAINEAEAAKAAPSPLSNLAALQNAINDAEAEPANNRVTPQPADRAASLAPETRGARYRRSISQQATPPPPSVDSHRVEDEVPPKDPFNAQAFQACLNDAKQSMTELAVALGSSALGQTNGSELRRLHLKAASLQNFQHPTRRTVGFVGASGAGKRLILFSYSRMRFFPNLHTNILAGKSSLLNCLLDRKDLDRTVSRAAFLNRGKSLIGISNHRAIVAEHVLVW